MSRLIANTIANTDATPTSMYVAIAVIMALFYIYSIGRYDTGREACASMGN